MSQQPFTVLEGKNVYLDFNATTPPAAFIAAKISEWIHLWGNPSSIHWSGRGPKAVLRETHKKVAQWLGVDALEIVFTSGGSEANNMALKGLWKLAQTRTPERKKILISAVEHPSVRETANALIEEGAIVETIKVNRDGFLDLEDFEAKLTSEVALVSVMFANNETGNIFPIGKLCKKAHKEGAFFHTDAVQALGKINFNLKNLGVDAASFSAHKFYALKGCGFGYIAAHVGGIDSLIHGGPQERRRRAGTENILAIAALSEVCQLASRVESESARVCELRDHLQERILAEISEVSVTGKEAPRLTNTLNLVVSGIDGESLLMNLDLAGFSVSTGAACSSGNPEPSPALLAMGLKHWEAQSSLRLSLGWSTQKIEIDNFVEALKETVSRLRKIRRDDELARR